MGDNDDSDNDDDFAGRFTREYFNDPTRTYVRPSDTYRRAAVLDDIGDEEWEEIGPHLLRDDTILESDRDEIIEHCDDSRYTFLPGRPTSLKYCHIT